MGSAALTGSMTTCDRASISPNVMLRSGTAVDRSHRRCGFQNGVSRNTTLTGAPGTQPQLLFDAWSRVQRMHMVRGSGAEMTVTVCTCKRLARDRCRVEMKLGPGTAHADVAEVKATDSSSGGTADREGEHLSGRPATPG